MGNFPLTSAVPWAQGIAGSPSLLSGILNCLRGRRKCGQVSLGRNIDRHCADQATDVNLSKPSVALQPDR